MTSDRSRSDTVIQKKKGWDRHQTIKVLNVVLAIGMVVFSCLSITSIFSINLKEDFILQICFAIYEM